MDLFERESIEIAEAELDRFIERRAREAGEAELIEAAWAESVRRHNARLREQNRWEWIRFFDRMARSHARISEDYQCRAEQLLEDPREGGGLS